MNQKAAKDIIEKSQGQYTYAIREISQVNYDLFYLSDLNLYRVTKSDVEIIYNWETKPWSIGGHACIAIEYFVEANKVVFCSSRDRYAFGTSITEEILEYDLDNDIVRKINGRSELIVSQVFRQDRKLLLDSSPSNAELITKIMEYDPVHENFNTIYETDEFIFAMELSVNKRYLGLYKVQNQQPTLFKAIDTETGEVITDKFPKFPNELYKELGVEEPEVITFF